MFCISYAFNDDAYIHMQQQSRQIVTVGSLFNDHFFAILSIFTGIFLVNYVLMNSAATVFSNTDGVVNLQDLNFLMDQVWTFLPICVISVSTGYTVCFSCFYGKEMILWLCVSSYALCRSLFIRHDDGNVVKI